MVDYWPSCRLSRLGLMIFERNSFWMSLWLVGFNRLKRVKLQILGLTIRLYWWPSLKSASRLRLSTNFLLVFFNPLRFYSGNENG
ncbi:hypothetical protein EPI10_015936 [Gossypium australe]|uniref:Uncharacterized protein n=1 Tax=Gossypium australe TaxID=47621 RepID=A0A5B6VMA7_9ROSI|nr:hypothetical protein EPI10_015936 [Gossypium australe]